jgi:hypothetical protein
MANKALLDYAIPAGKKKEKKKDNITVLKLFSGEYNYGYFVFKNKTSQGLFARVVCVLRLIPLQYTSCIKGMYVVQTRQKFPFLISFFIYFILKNGKRWKITYTSDIAK